MKLLVYQKRKKSHINGCIENCVNEEKIHIACFSSFSLKFLVQNVLNFQGDGKCVFFIIYLQVMSISPQQFVDLVFYWLITNMQKMFSVRKVINNEQFFIIHGKNILYQY